MAAYYQYTGNFSLALTYLDMALDMSLELNSKPDIAASYLNLAYYYDELGDFMKALKFYQLTLQYKLNLEAPNTGFVYLNIGNIYSNAGDNERSFLWYRKTIHYFNIEGYETFKAYAYTNMGDVFLAEGEIDSAYLYLHLAEPYLLEMGDSSDLMSLFINYGEIYNEKGLHGKANKYFNKVISYYSNQFNQLKHPDIAYVYNKKIRQRLNQNKLTNLITVIDSAKNANIMREGTSNGVDAPKTVQLLSRTDYMETLKLEAEYFSRLAKQYQHLNTQYHDTLFKSLQCFLRIFEWIDQMRNGYSQGAKLNISRTEKDTYSKAIEIALQLFKLTGDNTYVEIAFQVSEKCKALLLYELISEKQAKLEFHSINPELIQEENKLNEKLYYCRNLIYNAGLGNEQLLDSLKEKELQVLVEIDNFRENLKTRNQSYYDLKFNTQAVAIDDIQQKLKKNECLIEYFLTDSLLFSFYISKRKIHIVKKRINTERFNDLLNSFYSSLLNESIPDESLHKVSYSLYGQLFDSTWQVKRNSHLIIIPDERIAMVPFEVLNTSPEKTGAQKRNIHYLIRDYSVSYHYSAGLLYHTVKPPTGNAEHQVLAFAPGDFGPQYKSLKWNIDEVNRITSMLDGQKFTGNKATELKLKTNNSNESVLHLATHCIIDNNNPMMSYLLFAKDSLEKEDGKLYAHELFNMNLPHNLVALSACETGTGKLQSGEGLMAISRGFLYAGSPLILASLWAVDDKSTSDLMVYFYSYIKKGFPGHIALQKAKIDFLDNQPVARLHPKYWSGFILIGNASGLQKDHQEYNVFWLILLCICIGCLAFFIRKRFI